MTRRIERALAALAVVCLLASLLALSLAADSGWTTLTQRDGLLPGTVESLASGPDGQMLIGTRNGLCRWTGQQFETVTASRGLPEGAISTLAWDGASAWAGSWGGGLGHGRDAAWDTLTADDSGLPGDWIADLEATPDGLWIAHYGRGLARFGADGWELFRRMDGALHSDWLTCLLADDEGGLWIGSERAGLAYRSAQGSWTRWTLPGDDQTHVTSLANAEERIWVGTTRGLSVLDPLTGRWETLSADDGLPAGAVRALCLDDLGNVWIGGDGGLAYWDGEVHPAPLGPSRSQIGVTSLAVDNLGRVWAGLVSGGVAVRGSIDPPDIERRPIVLVHGWTVSEEDTLRASEFRHLARWLRQDGVPVVYASGISPRNTLYQNATRLAEVIAEACRTYDCSQVDLLAFSMGGLNSRALLETTAYQGNVRQAFLLGSPHRGALLWEDLLIWEYLAWEPDPSALELLPLHGELFNRLHSPSGEVPYTVIAGDASEQGLPALFGQLPPSDGLVSTWSALGVTGSAVQQIVCQDIHAYSDDILLAGIPSLLYPRARYDSDIRPAILGVATPEPDAPAKELLSEPALWPSTRLYTGTLSAGETITLANVPIDAPESVRLLCRWHGAPLEMTLIDPEGRRIDEELAADEDNIEHLSLDLADLVSYVFTDTLAGPWQVLLSTRDDSRKSSDYVLSVQQREAWPLTISSDQAWYSLREMVNLTVTLDGLSDAVAVEEVFLWVYGPTRQPRVIRLRPQEDAGYAGSLLVDEEGYWILMAEASGTLDGQPWSRGATHVIGVSSGSARMTGACYARQTVDGKTLVGVGLQVDHASTFLLSLRDADLDLTRAHPVTLAAGEQIAWVPLGTTLPATQTFDELLLVDISGPALLLDEVQDLILTAWDQEDQE